jgi:hypothetical protein
MRVKQLIQDLSTMDPEMEIVVGYWTADGIKEKLEEQDCIYEQKDVDSIMGKLDQDDNFPDGDKIDDVINEYFVESE